MTRKEKEKVTEEMRKNEQSNKRSIHSLSGGGETTDEQVAKRQRILANPPPIQRSFGAASTLPPYGWSVSPSPPSTTPPPYQWSSAPFPPSYQASIASRPLWLPASSLPRSSVWPPNPPPPIQRFFGAASTVPPYGWSLAPSPPSTIRPPYQWSWGPFLPSASTAPSCVWPPASSAPHLVGPRAAAATSPMGPPAAAATRYAYLPAGGAGYHFTDYSTLRALILANPPPIMRSDGAASTLPAYGWSWASVAPCLMGPPLSSAPCPVVPPAAGATRYPYLFAGGAGYHPPPVMRSYGAASTLPAYGWSRASVAPRPMGPPPSSAPCPVGPPAAVATRYPNLFAGGAGYHHLTDSELRALILANPPPVMRSYGAGAASTLPAYGWSWAASAPQPRPVVGPPAAPVCPPAASAPCPVGPPDERVDEAATDELELELRL